MSVVLRQRKLAADFLWPMKRRSFKNVEKRNNVGTINTERGGKYDNEIDIVDDDLINGKVHNM